MFTHNIVVRWPNGDLEGFSGFSSFNRATAQMRAEDKARNKAAHIDARWADVKLLTASEYNALSGEEKHQLQNDWNISARAFSEA